MDTVLMCSALEEDYGISLIRQGKNTEARKYYEEELKKVIIQLGKDNSECLNVKEKLAFSIYEMGSFLEAKELFDEIVREREKIYGQSHPLCLRIYMLMSVIMKIIGNKSGGDLLYAKLRKILDNMDKSTDDFAISCLLIAISYQNLFKTSEAEGILKELLQKQGNNFWKDFPLSLLIKVEIGHTVLVSGKYSEAMACLEDILKRHSNLSEKHYILYCLCRMDIAICCYKMSKFSEAKVQLEEILREQTVRIGHNDAESYNILTSMAQNCLEQHKFGEAKSVLEEVLNDQVEIYGKENFFFFKTSFNVVYSLIELRKFSEVKGSLELLPNKIALQYGKRNQLYLKAWRLKASLNIKMGKFSEAAAILEDLLLKQLDIVGKYHSDYLKTKTVLAGVYCSSGKVAESIHILEDVLRLKLSMFAADHEECLETKILIARMCIRLEKFKESATVLKEVVKSLKEKLGEEHRETIDAMGLFAATLFGLGRKEVGTPILEVFIRKMEATESNHGLITDICSPLMYAKEWEILKNLLEKCVEAYIEILGEYHVNILSYWAKLSACLLELKKSAEAKEVIYNVLAKLPKVNAPNDALRLEVKERIAFVLIGLSEHKKAVILLKEVLKTHEGGANDSKALSFMALIASSLFQMGKKSEMKSIVEKGSNRLLEIDWQDDRLIIKVATNFIGYCLQCEYHTLTMNLCKKLLSMPFDMFGENHPDYLMVMEVLGSILMKSGEFAEAKDIYAELLEKTKEIHGEGHEDFRRVREKFMLLLILSS